MKEEWGNLAENLPEYNSHLVIKPGEVSIPSENHPAFLWTSFYQYFVHLCGKTRISEKCAELHAAIVWKAEIFLYFLMKQNSQIKKSPQLDFKIKQKLPPQLNYQYK